MSFDWKADARISSIRKKLRTLYSIDINFDNQNIQNLTNIMKEYQQIKNKIISESVFNSYHVNPEYTKTILILESLKIFLSEVAPKRIFNKKKKSRN